MVVSDMQIPFHDRKAVEAVTGFIADYQPDVILCVGDESDSPEPSRWNRGMAGEYAGTLQKGLDETHSVLADMRAAAPNAQFHLQRSNHTDRIKTYIGRYAPALTSLRAVQYEALIGLAELDVTFHKEPYAFAPGWVMMHGDEGSLNRTAGGTALGLARRVGASVVCGHTHRAGLIHDHASMNGRITRPLWGFEVGNLMDMRQAGYLGAGSANWQQAIGLFHVDGKRVTPTLVPITSKAFTVEGVTYEW